MHARPGLRWDRGRVGQLALGFKVSAETQSPQVWGRVLGAAKHSGEATNEHFPGGEDLDQIKGWSSGIYGLL